jgi:hypothetical protein
MGKICNYFKTSIRTIYNFLKKKIKLILAKIEQLFLPLIPTFAIACLFFAIALLLAPIFSVSARSILASTTGMGSYYGGCIAAIGVMLTALLVHRRSIDEFHLREQREKEFRDEQILESRRINLANQRSQFSKQLSDTARQFGSKEPIVQASAVTGILLQIDAWYQLEKLESFNIEWEKNRRQNNIVFGGDINTDRINEDHKYRLQMLCDESRRKRQELFYLAFRGNVDKPSLEFFLARCAGFKERIRSDGMLDSFDGLSIDGVELGALRVSHGLSEDSIIPADFSNISFRKGLALGGNFTAADFSYCDMQKIKFHNANLSSANFSFSDLRGADLSSSFINERTTFTGAIYNSETRLPEKIEPSESDMRFSDG